MSPDVLLPLDAGLLSRLFDDPDMFDSSKSFHRAGFDVIERSSDARIMAGTHDDAKGYLFKKYSNDHPLDDQLENYQVRVEGARRVRALIDAHRLREIVVPRKWIWELSPAFSRGRKRLHPSHVLIVERFKLLDKHETEREYFRIDKRTLDELCLVVFHLNGLDSTPKNVPFTKGGKIAFIDTESWDRHHGREHLKYLGKFLSFERLDRARATFEDLENKAKRARNAEKKR